MANIHTDEFLSGIADLIRDVQADISPEYRAFDGDDEPGIQLTVACDDAGEDYSYQTGDNSYTGGAYHYPHWAVVGVYEDSGPEALAREIASQLADLIAE